MTNGSSGTKHEKREIIESKGKFDSDSRGKGAGGTIFRPMVVVKVAWPTANLHIHIKSKVSVDAN